MDYLHITLSTVRKYRNTSEWRPVGRVVCAEYSIERTGDGSYLQDVCRAALEAGADPGRLVDVRRNGTRCFELAPIWAWAFPADKRPDHLKRAAALRKSAV